MLVELYYVTNAYAFNTVRDDSNFAVNLWDYFYKNSLNVSVTEQSRFI